MFADARAELRHVGCNSDTVDGNWTASSQKALELFHKHAGLKLDVKAASIDAAVEARTRPHLPADLRNRLSGRWRISRVAFRLMNTLFNY